MLDHGEPEPKNMLDQAPEEDTNTVSKQGSPGASYHYFLVFAFVQINSLL
jgi:hypothetical protein